MNKIDRYHVMQYYNSMSDFVTSRFAEITFKYLKNAKQYIKNFERKNPGRAHQWIIDSKTGKLIN
jgi:hypothetical protein